MPSFFALRRKSLNLLTIVIILRVTVEGCENVPNHASWVLTHPRTLDLEWKCHHPS